MKAEITYYGIRGSTPACGPQFNKYGGNTTCVSFETEDTLIIIDAGTGIRNLGKYMMQGAYGKGGKDAHLFLTHTHWDHIQGFPFFIPAYLPQNTFEIYGELKSIQIKNEKGAQQTEDWSIHRTFYMQQTFMYFPASTEEAMASKLNFHNIKPSEEFIIGDITIKTLRMFHPNNTLGYRIEHNGKVFTFCTDVEHNANMIENLSAFAEGSDVFAFDSQYAPEEYENGRQGWGHSTYEVGAKISQMASVKNYHLIHHDPEHDDDFLDNMQQKTKNIFSNSLVVPEGLKINF